MPLWANYVVTGSELGINLFADNEYAARALKKLHGGIIVRITRK